jgi:FlaA1/EpsC-like NDP-sugar epimerase
MYNQIATLPRRIKILLMLALDTVLIPFALWSAIALRLGTPQFPVSQLWWILMVLPVLTIPAMIKLGLYRAVIRYFDEKIIFTVIIGVTFSVLVLTLLVVMAQVQGIPRSSIIIYWVISVLYITLSRYLARGIIRQFERRDRRRQKVAIYGAGRAGLQTALSLITSPEYQPVLFFDDSKEVQGTSIAGIRVHKPENAIALMAQHECYQLLLAIPSASRAQKNKIIQEFQDKGIQLKIIPGLNAIVDGRLKIEEIREVGVEDLLGRDPVPADEALVAKVTSDKVVMITGGGGSIGSEICRQVALRHPRLLVIFEISEFSLYKIVKELNLSHPQLTVIPILGDVTDNMKVRNAMSDNKVDVLFHAAAYKHVPLVEQNIVAGAKNNIFGTLSVLEAAKQSKVKHFILISTDKAVRPTNVMGATKRVAEQCVQMYARNGNGTIYSMVRFGNVLGSSGSVVPLFKEQIRAGGPVTVTHPEITRYFMTIPEACELVLQSAAMAKGGDLFVLDMGEPVKILEMAKKMIQLSGFTVRDTEYSDGDIAIEFIGLRPGEKLYEELLLGENVTITEHQRIRRAEEDSLSDEKLSQFIDALKMACHNYDKSTVVNQLKLLLPEFNYLGHE